MPNTPNYRGDSAVVFQGERSERNEQGVWVRMQQWSGIKSALKSFAAQFPAGNKITIDDNGPIATASITLGFLTGDGSDSSPVDKWEDDTEPIEKDLAYSDLAQQLSTDGQRILKSYRNALTSDDKDEIDADAKVSVPSEYDTLAKLFDEVDRGVESVPVNTLVLKRTRTMAVAYATPRVLTVKQTVYSTAAFIDLEKVPEDIAAMLPTNPYPAPDNSQWSWRPRLSNRTFTGRGLVEEQHDWVFAAYSTNLYTYVA